MTILESYVAQIDEAKAKSEREAKANAKREQHERQKRCSETALDIMRKRDMIPPGISVQQVGAGLAFYIGEGEPLVLEPKISENGVVSLRGDGSYQHNADGVARVLLAARNRRNNEEEYRKQQEQLQKARQAAENQRKGILEGDVLDIAQQFGIRPPSVPYNANDDFDGYPAVLAEWKAGVLAEWAEYQELQRKQLPPLRFQAWELTYAYTSEEGTDTNKVTVLRDVPDESGYWMVVGYHGAVKLTKYMHVVSVSPVEPHSTQYVVEQKVFERLNKIWSTYRLPDGAIAIAESEK